MDDTYEVEVRGLEQRMWEAHPWAGRLVLYGSSSIRFWAFERDFPDLLSVNMGFGGSTLQAVAHYFERLVVPLQPAACVFYAGDNDLGNGDTPEKVLQSYHKLMAKYDRYFPGRPFAWIAIKPSVSRWDLREQIGQTNAWTKADVDRRQNGYWVDVYWPMLQELDVPQPSAGDVKPEAVDIAKTHAPRGELYTADGLHLNRAGYQVWSEAIQRDAGPILALGREASGLDAPPDSFAG